MIAEVLKYSEEFNADTKRLKGLSPTYPEMYEETRRGMFGKYDEFIVSSMVEFVYNGVRFKRHHVEREMLTPSATKELCKERLIHNAELCKKYAVPISLDDIVGVEK